LSNITHRSLAHRLLATDAGWTPLALRIPVGIIFVAHGAQKLFGAFGGYGLEGTGQFMDSIGLNPGYMMALLAGSAEFFGGLALLFGLLVRPAAATLAFAMVVAILAVHIDKGCSWPTTATSSASRCWRIGRAADQRCGPPVGRRLGGARAAVR